MGCGKRTAARKLSHDHIVRLHTVAPSLGDGGRASVVGLRMSHSSLRTASDSRGPEPLLVHLDVVCFGLKTQLLRVEIEMLRGIVAENCLGVVRLI